MSYLTSKLKPTLARRARFYALYLCRSIDDPKMQTYPGSNRWLHDHAMIVLDAPLNQESDVFEDQVRVMEFDQYCESVELHLLLIGMSITEDEFIKPDFPYPHPPVEITYVRVTRLGRFYARLPYPLQVAMIFTMEKVSQLASAWSRYKWIGSFVALVLGFTGWSKTHQFSGLLVVGSTLGGLVVTWLLSTIASYFGAEHHGMLGDDP